VTPAILQEVLDVGDGTTGFMRSRRARELDQRGWPRPGVRQWGGWRRYGGGVLRENSGALILCEIAKGKNQGGAPCRGEGGRRERGS
jgi:hypothetical protein